MKAEDVYAGIAALVMALAWGIVLTVLSEIK